MKPWEFLTDEVDFLGYMTPFKGIKANPKEVSRYEAIKGNYEEGSYFIEFNKDCQRNLSIQNTTLSLKFQYLLYCSLSCLPNTSIQDFLVKWNGKPKVERTLDTNLDFLPNNPK